jgi:tetrahydrodipicolinate N-succinyltransferase
VTIGANATIGPGVTLGEFSMVGMGSVVTKDVAPYSLVVGNPARPAGLGVRLWTAARARVQGARPAAASVQLTCDHCHRKYFWDASGFHAVAPGGGR